MFSDYLEPHSPRRWVALACCILAAFTAYHCPAVLFSTIATLAVYCCMHPQTNTQSTPSSKCRPKSDPCNVPSKTEFLSRLVSQASSPGDDCCIICRDEELTDAITTPCQHTFCSGCFTEYVKRGFTTCPQCTKIMFHNRSIAPKQAEDLLRSVHIVAVLITITTYLLRLCGTTDSAGWLHDLLTLGVMSWLCVFRCPESPCEQRQKALAVDSTQQSRPKNEVTSKDEIDDRVVGSLTLACIMGAWVIFEAVMLDRSLTMVL